MKKVNNIIGVKDLSNNNINYINSNSINSLEDKKEQIMQIDKNNMPKLKKIKTKKKEIDKRNYITHIKLNKCYLCFFFLCTKKRKNVQNILINEGISVITQNLDILNIFNKIYRDGKIEDIIKNHTLKMSDECVNRLVRLKK